MRVAAAQINGIAAGAVQVNQVTDEEAFAEVAAVLDKPKAHRQVALDLAIGAYVRPGSGRPEVWYAAAAAFRERAGARPAVLPDATLILTAEDLEPPPPPGYVSSLIPDDALIDDDLDADELEGADLTHALRHTG